MENFINWMINEVDSNGINTTEAAQTKPGDIFEAPTNGNMRYLRVAPSKFDVYDATAIMCIHLGSYEYMALQNMPVIVRGHLK